MKSEMWFEYAMGVVIFAIAALCLFAMIALVGNEQKALAQYPTDFTAIIDQCGERAASSVVVSGISIKGFNPGVFLDCAAQNNVTFELNGDAVKVANND
jgi:hypothetical protein